MSETKFKILDLFSGVGGFSLGLERTGGFETVAFCEQDEKAKLVLNKNWPTVPVYGDIKELTFERLQADGLIPTVITGGFPCQDISSAGKGEGIIGERSGLWSEMFRLIRDVRPAWAIIENVSTLRSKGLTLVLQNLCEIGYCAEWHCIPASAVGAPHQRDRIWITAYRNPDSYGQPIVSEYAETSGLQEYVADAVREHQAKRGECETTQSEGGVGGDYSRGSQGHAERERSVRGSGGGAEETVADAYCERCQRRYAICTEPDRQESTNHAVSCGAYVANTHEPRLEGWLREGLQECTSEQSVGEGSSFKGRLSDQWRIEPNVGRVANGVPNRVDRLKQLGNAVVPQIPQLIGHAILAAEKIHRDNQ